MNHKKLILLLAVLTAILLAVGVGFYYFNKSAPTKMFEISDQIISDKTSPFDISITYPKISGLDELNKEIKDTVESTLKDFKEISLENDSAIKENDPESYAKYPRSYYLSISYEKGLIDENTASIILYVENFTGGAHGAHYPIAFNYDVKNKKDIKLSDLFLNQPDYLQKISDFCSADLKKQILERTQGMDEGWILEGAGPKEENFSTFMINKNSITFYFSEYQVAAYALGSFEVVYPL